MKTGKKNGKRISIKSGTWDVLLYAAAFVIPVLIMLVMLSIGGFYPFGDKSMFIMDMRDQYLEFFASLRNLFTGEGSLFFSWSRSMGGNYIGLFAYYIASPLSFITLLFPLKNMTAAIVVLTVLKLGLCGLSFAVYGNYIWKRTHQEPFFAIPVFAVCYAMMSYNMVYSLCPMWLDGVIFLPIVLLGVEKILDGKKGLHYMLALAGLFVCNYYTGYMVGLFTGLYMVYRILCEVRRGEPGKDWKACGIRILRFTASTFLAFGISAPLLLPVIRDLMEGRLAAQTYQPDISTNFDTISQLTGKLLHGVYDSITNSGLPAVYCGFLATVLAVVFFFLYQVSVRERIGAAVILLLFVLSFYYTKLDIAWHGFQYPNWFPYRYAFLFSFFLLYLAMRTISVLFLVWQKRIAVFKSKNKAFRKKAAHNRWVLPSVLCILILVVSFEMGHNGVAMMDGLNHQFGYGMVEDYETFIDKTQPLVDEIKDQDQELYRINQYYEYSKNDAMLLGYNGMTHYSSTFNAAVNSLTPKLGIAQSHMWNSGYGSNPMLDSLFGVKYILSDKPVPAYYQKISDSTQGTASYRNDRALSFVYSAPVSTVDPDLDQGDPFIGQNAFLNAIAGTTDGYFTDCPYTTVQQGNSYSITFTADTSGPAYLYMESGDMPFSAVYVNNQWVGNYFSSETECSLYLGTPAAGETVMVTVAANESGTIHSVRIAQLHMDRLEKTMDALQKNTMKTVRHRGGTLSGTIVVEEGEKIVTSIPCDSGWTVTLDGEKVDPGRFADTFICIDAEPGEHEIRFSYISPGFWIGLVFFACALILGWLYFRWERIKFRFFSK